MILNKINKKNKLIILIVLLSLLILSYLLLINYNINSLKKYNDKILPNIYVEGVDLSNLSYNKGKSKMDYYSNYILSKEVNLVINNKEYNYKLSDLGVSIDFDTIYKDIIRYQKKLSYSEKLMGSSGRMSKDFDCRYKIDNNKLVEFLNSIKTNVDLPVTDGYFDTSQGVSYVKGTPGYSLDISKNTSVINDIFKQDKFVAGMKIELNGDSVGAQEIESYASIDTMTSSFVTTFIPNTYLRNINLNTALSYINGSVVKPGEVFSYCDKAGPFDKSGYVFYYEFVGNGVCQIATTTYNAALLGGLEIVKRYPHDKKSAYVDGGLDATVASYGGGWCVDMQFKNTYKYPIYIKAFSEGGRAHVEFWSNSNAKEGREYTTESVWLGGRGYESYLHTFKDGVEISRDKIATTWYTKD